MGNFCSGIKLFVLAFASHLVAMVNRNNFKLNLCLNFVLFCFVFDHVDVVILQISKYNGRLSYINLYEIMYLYKHLPNFIISVKELLLLLL